MAIRWTVRKRGIVGSRWDAWKGNFEDILSWDDFKDNVAKYNPHLSKATGWCFVPEYTYILPEVSTANKIEALQNKYATDMEQLISNDNVEATLKFGSGSRESVRGIQNILNDLGFGEALKWQEYGADGDYGIATAQAVCSFAAKNGFTSDGEKVTPAIAEQLLTRLDALDDLRNIYNALQDGKVKDLYYSQSPHHIATVSLQTLLRELGYGEELNWGKYGADGDYGKCTSDALRAFAKKEGIAADGLTLTNELAERIIDKLQIFYGEGWAQDVEIPEKTTKDLTIKETMIKGKKRIIVSDGNHNRVQFTKHKKGIYSYGNQKVEDFVKKNKAALDRAGITDSAINVMLAVSENEGHLDGVNTWDNSFMTFGIFQWTLGVGNDPGELAALLRKLKNHDVKVFETCFGKYGLDVADAGPISGYLSLNGRKLSSPIEKELLRTYEWAFHFGLAGQDKEVQSIEIQHALSRIDVFYRSDHYKVKKYFLSDLVKSEYGVGLLLDNHVNRPGYLTGCLATALEKAGLPEPGDWGDDEEKELIYQ